MWFGGFASTRRVFEDWANDVVATTTPTASVDSYDELHNNLLLRAAMAI
jgi:hypothetical protein